MQRSYCKVLCAVALASIAAGCSTDNFTSLSEAKFLPTADFFRSELRYSGVREDLTLGPANAAELIGPDGQCGAAAFPAEGSAPDGSPPMTSGGIALQMTECDVVRRAGTPDNIEVGSGPRGGRAVVLTYNRGARPGIYRFTDGRLYAVERGAEPAPRQQKAAPKKRT